jgi:hypothetical protein
MPKKKSFTDPTLSYLSEPEEKEEAEKVQKIAPRKSKALRRIDGASATQAGLTPDYTRASMVISVKNKQAIDDIAYTNRDSIKDTLESLLGPAVDKYLASHKVLHKGEKEGK